MIRNILLAAPRHRRYVSNASTFNLHGIATPHTGLTIMARILWQRGYHTRVIDEKVSPIRDQDIAWADLVGISVQTITSIQGYKLARRARLAGKTTVLGGVHPTLNPDEALCYSDYVVRNEGEHTLLELVDELNRQRPASSGILGLSHTAGGRRVHNRARPFIEDLDALPVPDLREVRGMGRRPGSSTATGCAGPCLRPGG